MDAILVPVDYSLYATNALVYGLHIAAQTGWKCYALKVAKLRFTSFMQSVTEIAQKEKQALEEAAIELAAFCDNVQRNHPRLAHISIEQIVRIGLVVEEILSIVDEFNFKLLVMGTQGADKTEKKIFGSNTALVIENTTTPVLAIPANAVFSPIANVVFALDIHKRLNEKTTQFICDFTKAFNANLCLLYVQNKQETDIEKMKEQVLKWFDYPNVSFQLITDTNVLHGIEAFVKANKLDILALVARDHATFSRIFGSSLVREIAHHFDYPFLALH
jgi:nucleotide-binding universal stress UspA family protein